MSNLTADLPTWRFFGGWPSRNRRDQFLNQPPRKLWFAELKRAGVRQSEWFRRTWPSSPCEINHPVQSAGGHRIGNSVAHGMPWSLVPGVGIGRADFSCLPGISGVSGKTGRIFFT